MYPRLNKYEGLLGKHPLRYGGAYLGLELEILMSEETEDVFEWCLIK